MNGCLSTKPKPQEKSSKLEKILYTESRQHKHPTQTLHIPWATAKTPQMDTLDQFLKLKRNPFIVNTRKTRNGILITTPNSQNRKAKKSGG